MAGRSVPGVSPSLADWSVEQRRALETDESVGQSGGLGFGLCRVSSPARLFRISKQFQYHYCNFGKMTSCATGHGRPYVSPALRRHRVRAGAGIVGAELWSARSSVCPSVRFFGMYKLLDRSVDGWTDGSRVRGGGGGGKQSCKQLASSLASREKRAGGAAVDRVITADTSNENGDS